ncbi:glycine hydroxymethyltransferase [Pseudomonas typographi]|uniref:Glycine hydroxymethyltransferase n=1 Tax=Pseudomonas typographi TaxID=2715964 RepID=A0ABR7YX73_9PSED|nr:glycine hydroxymethyltransferase [Pseudomonas typographi]MBD1551176.1 glycine hydroxymethyltransferase [Pseudomonas typographi]MBD1586330.1 glycine hydroxymethyltransferase [Pseudomonas typographi]MBD1597802.1 glycine hydroxymethyltransferase [Pseudomonas typographi]
MEMLNEQQLLEQAAGRGAVLKGGRIVLYAGANLPSLEAQQAYSPGLSAYPAMGPSFAKEQPDTDGVSGLELAVSQRICGLFGAQWAEPRLPSCTIANLAVFHAFSQPGDLLLAPAAAHGGHLSQRRGGTPSLAGLRVEELPFDTRHCCLDAPRAAELVRERRPALVMLGRSVIIKPDDIEPVVAAAREVGAKSIFDASHVSGLIAGGTFPNPLALGVDVLTSSTYKTLPGRPHSLIAGRHPADGKRLAQLIDGALLANYDAGRLPSLLLTLREVQANGKAYAERVCANAQALAQALRQCGVTVIAPMAGEAFTHQILIPMAAEVPAAMAMAAMERHGILLGTCADPTTPGGYALRVGTQFITTQGQAQDLGSIAQRLAGALRPSAAGRMALA